VVEELEIAVFEDEASEPGDLATAVFVAKDLRTEASKVTEVLAEAILDGHIMAMEALVIVAVSVISHSAGGISAVINPPHRVEYHVVGSQGQAVSFYQRHRLILLPVLWNPTNAIGAI